MDQLQRVALEMHGAEARAAYRTRRRFLEALFLAPTMTVARGLVREHAAFEQRTRAELDRLAAKGGLPVTKSEG